jgi:DNA-binding LacI/PurR family transcriptional regulator
MSAGAGRGAGGRGAGTGVPRATIDDVARLAGVSTATVSRSLSGAPYVREATRALVLAAAAELDFRPSITAQSLTTGRSLVVGIVVSDIEIPFFTSVARAIQDVAHRHGYLTLVGNSDELASAEDELVRAFTGRMVDGLIATPAAGPNTQLREVAGALPLVLVDRLIPGVEADAVLSANREGARAAAEHLIALGHRRIAYVTDKPDKTSTEERLAGFRDALEAAGLPFEPELCPVVDYHPDPAQRSVRELLRRHHPTALIASEGSITLGSFRAAQELGMAIPDELSLIGFDQLDWGTATTPPITVVSQDAERIGAAAARMLIRQITRASSGAGAGSRRARPPVIERVPTSLVERASCAPPRSGNRPA